MNPRFETRDVSSKADTLRSAKAVASLSVSPATVEAIRSGKVPKADPLAVAKVAAIQSAKQTSLLIPYCHQVPLDYIGVDIRLENDTIVITTEVKAIWKTGVEMEALVAASAAALTLYDMLKIIDTTMEIQSVRLTEKKGGKSALRDSGSGLTAAVIVLSDSVSKGEKEDESGKLLLRRLQEFEIDVSHYAILPDDRAMIENTLCTLAESRKFNLIITTGGTGIGPRDVTPEATAAVIERRLDGVEETLRSFGQHRIATAMFSRSVVGVRGSTVIINFPGSSSGVEDGINALFPSILHSFRMLNGEGH